MSAKILGINRKILITISVIVVTLIVAIVMHNLKENSAENSIENSGVNSVVNNYAKAMEDKDVSKMLDYIDFKGAVAWQNGDFNAKDFSNSDYEDFIEEYNNVRTTEHHNARDVIRDYYNNFFDNGNEENIYINGEINKLGKDLYAVEIYSAFGGDGWGRCW